MLRQGFQTMFNKNTDGIKQFNIMRIDEIEIKKVVFKGIIRAMVYIILIRETRLKMLIVLFV